MFLTHVFFTMPATFYHEWNREHRMQPQELMQAQIDSALAGLTRIRERLSGAGSAERLDQIGHDLDWAASHLEDIRHIWLSLKSDAMSRNPVRSPIVVVSAIRPAATGF